MTEPPRRSLGRGLSALFGDEATEVPAGDAQTAPVEKLTPGRYQPRRNFDPEELAELARSIADRGILQPILVRRHPDDPEMYEIIAGERRWRAAQLANLHQVPVITRSFSDQEALEIGLIENLQRKDLTAIEEAEGYRRLLDDFAHTQEALAETVGKSRSHVTNTLRLLTLPDPVKSMVDKGELTAGHARALIGTENPAALAKVVLRRGLSVRQTEKLVSTEKDPAQRRQPLQKDADTVALERDLTALLGLDVEIQVKRGGGTLLLHYRSLDQLDDILHRLNRLPALAGEPVPTNDEPAVEGTDL